MCIRDRVAGISAAGCINRKIESNFNVNSISPGGKEENGVSVSYTHLKSHENPYIKTLYEEYLGKPLSETAEHQMCIRDRQSFPDCAITLSLGEKSREAYERFFLAGANRYLLRHERISSCRCV